MGVAALAFERVTCAFADRAGHGHYVAVRDTSFDVAPGEFVSVVGPTGCGKSTLLNVAAGLLAPSSGRVLVDGAPLSDINARAGYMFQAEALMPWRNALSNVAAGLEFRGTPPAETRRARDRVAGARRPGGLRVRATRTSSPAACASASRSRRC